MMDLPTLFLLTSLGLNLPPGLLDSVCFVESLHNTKAIHRNDGKGSSLGVCQIKLRTARSLGFRGTEKELMEPATNIHWAGKYLAYQLKRYHGNARRAVAAYNRGSSKGDGFNAYSRKVFEHWRRLRDQAGARYTGAGP